MKILAKNRRATFDYEILERIEAGIQLAGPEVKSVKLGHISLKGSFVTFTGNEAFLTNAHITPYQHSAHNEDPDRSRKLLLARREIEHLTGASKSKGMSVIPLAVGVSHGLIKIEIGLGKGKGRIDKREVIKKRQTERELNRRVKN